jgi:hypothetical protein
MRTFELQVPFRKRTAHQCDESFDEKKTRISGDPSVNEHKLFA